MSGGTGPGADALRNPAMLFARPIAVAKARAKTGDGTVRMEARDVSVSYGSTRVLHGVSIPMRDRSVTALIGPSGCGKTTFLRCLNRMNDAVGSARVEGRILLDGKDIYAPGVNVTDLRVRVGLVFQRSNPFPKSIFDNVAYGIRINKIGDRSEMYDRVETALRKAALWDEVANRLDEAALGLSGGQQQRLCIARALAVEPEVLLMDEPASALDPIATAKIEELVHDLKRQYTIVIVTHNMQQAARVSDYTAFLMLGELVEFGETVRLFTTPREKLTEDYVTGRFG